MISPPHSGSWIWGPERGGGGRTPSPSEHRAQPSPAASASASLPVSAEPHPLPSSPPQPAQFGEAAGVRRGGWQQADSRAHRGGGPHGKWLGPCALEAPTWAGSPLSPGLSSHTHTEPLACQGSPPASRAPSARAQALAGSGAQGRLPPLFVVSGLEAGTVCDAGPGELDGDPGETRAALPARGVAGPVPGPSGEPGVVCAPGRPVGRGRPAAPPSCQLGLVIQLPLPPPPCTHHLTLRAFSPTVAAMGEGVSFHKPACRVTLALAPTLGPLYPKPHHPPVSRASELSLGRPLLVSAGGVLVWVTLLP